MDGSRAPIDLTARRSVWGVITTAAALYRRYPVLYLLLALAVVAPYELIVLAATGTSPLDTRNDSASTTVLLLLIEFGVVVPWISALHVRAVANIGRGQRPGLQAVALQGVRVLPVVTAAQLVADVGILIGLVAFVVPGILLALRWAVVAQVAAIEGTDWMGALRRGASLTRGSLGHVFGVLFLTSLFTYLVVVAAVAVGGHHHGAGVVVLGIAVDTITRSFTALTTAVLYYGLVGRGEAAARPAPPAY